MFEDKKSNYKSNTNKTSYNYNNSNKNKNTNKNTNNIEKELSNYKKNIYLI